MRPRVLTVQDAFNCGEAVAECTRVLLEGGLVVIPTDTVYGVAAHPDRPEAIARIYEAKVRPEGKPIPLLAANIEAVERFGARLKPEERALAARFWPGPLTLVLATSEGADGFRVPDHRVTHAVLAACGGVLRVTSANRSGDAESRTVREVVASIGSSVELVLDAGPVREGVPSTVVRILDGDVRVLRQGALSLDELRAVLVETAPEEGGGK